MQEENYAKALFDILEKLEAAKEDYDAVIDVLRMIASDMRIYKLLLNPTIKHDVKFGLLSCLPEFLCNFLLLLCKNKRIKMLHQIIYKFKILVNCKYGVENITIVTASEKYNESIIEKYMISGDYDIMHIIDKSIIGGYIIKIDNKILDKSIKRYLADLAFYMNS